MAKKIVKSIPPPTVIKVNIPVEVNMTQVSSSQIDSIGFINGLDGNDYRVFILFHSGGLYMFLGVPKKVYMNLFTSESHGSFFAQEIKGKYPYQKVG